MAILAFFTGKISKAQYEVLRKEVHWEKAHPKGVLLHAASFDDAGGIHIADIWESAEEMGAWAQAKLRPAMDKHGITPPEIAIYPVHNINEYPALRRYAV